VTGWTPETLKEHYDVIAASNRMIGLVAAIGLISIVMVMNAGNAKATALALEGQREATRVALEAANDKGAAHNGLIERMRELSSTYVTKTTVFLVLGAILGWGTLAWTVLSPLLMHTVR